MSAEILPLSSCPRIEGRDYIVMRPNLAGEPCPDIAIFHGGQWCDTAYEPMHCEITGWIDFRGEAIEPETVDPDAAFLKSLQHLATAPIPATMRDWAKTKGLGEKVDQLWPETVENYTVDKPFARIRKQLAASDEALKQCEELRPMLEPETVPADTIAAAPTAPITIRIDPSASDPVADAWQKYSQRVAAIVDMEPVSEPTILSKLMGAFGSFCAKLGGRR